MTGVPGTVGRPGWELPRAPGRLKTERPARIEALVMPPLALRAVPFFLLAFFAAAHWTALVDPAQTRRAFVAALVATLGGVVISLTGRLPRPSGTALRLLVLVVMTMLALTAIGIRFKLLLPAHWGTLADRIDGGLAVVGSVSEWPYDGPNLWLRLTTLLVAPLVLVPASAFVFWPRSKEAHPVYRALALVMLVALYAVSVAARPHDQQALRGLGLLVCLAAWLWLPRLTGRDAAAALTAIAAMAVVALALTPQLASSQPWIDYRHWSWNLHREKTITFNWRHTYGPLDWPRKGSTVLLIRSKGAHYWKAESLDRFDGARWTNTPVSESDPTYANTRISSNPKWFATAHVTVRGLKSQLVVGPGSLLSFDGLPGEPVVLANGVYLLNGELGSGTTYTVRGYAPDPSARQMRAAPQPSTFFNHYTALTLPQKSGAVARVVHVPLRGRPATGDPDAAREIEASRYARVYALAKSVSAGATTNYDIVRKVGAWLEGHYGYSERVPVRKYPLEAFLFQDRKGYCQHFSGAAALMLRMLGIPVRVASGFAPGTLNSDTHEYVVRDLDAHSWIEVWFERIGWVPFDPTPALAPASSQAASFTPFSEIASAARGDSKDRLNPKLRAELLGKTGGNAGSGALAPSGSSTPWGWIAIGALVALLALAAVVVSLLRLRGRRGSPPPSCGDPEVDHLVRLLTRAGLEIEPGTTLLELERRIERLGGQEAAGYAQRLRRLRFGTGGVSAPSRAERRKFRRTLAAAVGAGPLARLHLAMPDNLVVDAGLRKVPGTFRRPRQ